tara:strand:+ start:5808 stop:6035 length:228 start_codon:yes stop_codon:yes gene_type:complete
MDDKDFEETTLVVLVIDETGSLISVQNNVHEMNEEQRKMFMRVVTVHRPSFILLAILNIEIGFKTLYEKMKEYFK